MQFTDLVVKGRVLFVLDAQMGSTSKGLVTAAIVKKARPQNLLTANSANASHTVVDTATPHPKGGRYVFKVLPVGAFYWKLGEYTPHIWIGPGAAFDPEDLFKEMVDMRILKEYVHVHPNAVVIEQRDRDFENGLVTFEGDKYGSTQHDSGTTAFGTTGSGSGCARARKALRKARVAREDPRLAEMLYDPRQLVYNLSVESAVMDGSQGYFLGYNTRFYPFATSRSCSLASFCSEMDLPPSLIGHVVAVARSLPIRIASQRFFDPEREEFLTQAQCQAYTKQGRRFEVVDSPSGDWFSDQEELTWEQVSVLAGRHIEPEVTTLTKLQRRIATFSHIAWDEFKTMNAPTRPFEIHLALTFTNYLGDSAPDLLSTLKPSFISDSPETDSVVAYMG